jgi:hypothetical protein
MQIAPPVPRLFRQLALVAALCVCSLSLPAQFQSQQSAGGLSDAPDAPEPIYTTAHLDGVVVSSLDGKPVPRVLVTSPDQRMAAITDYSGRFSFDLRRAVPQSAAHVFASYPPDPVTVATTMPIRFHVFRPGYVGDDVTVRVPANLPDTPEPTLRLKIVPSATLTGHLDPDSGDLPPDATVMLVVKSVSNGSAIWGYRNAQVNSRGEFRFADLPPGDVKLFAPAYNQQFKQTEPLPDSIPGFRAAYYPNASSFDAAGVIHLGPGETTREDLVYRSATFYNVVIPVTGLPEGKVFNVTMLDGVPGFASVSLSRNGNTAQGYLPNGDFDIQLTSAEGSTRENQHPIASIASAHLQIDGKPVRTQPVAFHEAFQAPIEIRFEAISGPPPLVDPQHPQPLAMVGFEPIGTVGLRPVGVGMSTQSSVARNLSEGLFRVTADTMSFGYVSSITSGSTDLLREPLRILPGVAPRPIEITIRDDSASIDARLAPAANLLPQATSDQPVSILCIPLDHPQAQAHGVATPQDEFAIKGLAPGRYLILASHQDLSMNTERTPSIEYRNPDVLRDLIPKGAVVTLSSGQQASVQVPLMPEDAN